MRGVAANLLWGKANEYKKKKDWTNLSATLNQIAKLEPHFIGVWRFQAWNLSYNVSVEFDDYRERYQWIIRGIDFLREGVRYNDREAILLWDLGWFTGQKIGRADERKQFRKLFKEDDEFHESLPPQVRDPSRDNWLVGKNWFREAEDLVDSKGVPIKGTSPLLFRSESPMCQMNYANALEVDGTFGEAAKRAWMKGGREWADYGQLSLPTPSGRLIRLGDLEAVEQRMKKLTKKLDALQPGLREKLREERLAALSQDERVALDTSVSDRTAKQHELASEAQAKINITNKILAREIKGAMHQKAIALAKELTDAEREKDDIERSREIINYGYWEFRTEIEQSGETLAARKSIYKGEMAFAGGDLMAAIQGYKRGLRMWRRVLDKFPFLLDDQRTGEDLMEVVNRYRTILFQVDQKLPKDFILNDVVERYGKEK